MKQFRTAIKWLWAHRGENKWWQASVLTAENKDPSNPGLNAVEAASVFRVLEEERLIFKFDNPDTSGATYMMNEAREADWRALLWKMNPWYRFLVMPSAFLVRNGWGLIVWFLSLVIAALISGYVKSLFN